ncbi:hypothetical protein DFH09DRAFT_1353606 [Mycena vulgaris]|nr:hypothetical protein DFH09DRAFT_1353606 [Mycena vulgaris]
MQSAHPEHEHRESTPLLIDQVHLEAQQPVKKQTPLPKAQLAALCVSRVTDPLAYTQIFPYINEFLILLHVTNDVSRIALFSGIVESTFAVSQTLTSFYWAKLSDVVGRRPIILVGSLGLGVVTLLLGFLHLLNPDYNRPGTSWIFSRQQLQSIMLSSQRSPTRATKPLHILYTHLLGHLVPPSDHSSVDRSRISERKYPKYFGYDFILSHPYFMPNFVCSLLVMVGFLLSYHFLEETLPSKRRGRAPTVDQQSSPLGAMDLLKIPMMAALTASAFALGFIGTAFDVVFVLFCYTPIQKGGLSFSVNEIGYALAMNGGILAIFQLFFMPTLLRTYNAAKMYNTSMRTWPLTFFLMPFLNIIVRRGYDGEHTLVDPATYAILWIGIAVVLTCSRIAALAYATNMILIRTHAPGAFSLGSANGLVQMVMCVSRCFSPAFISSVFALSVGNS